MHFLSSITAAMAIGLATAMPQSEVLKRSAEPEFENGVYVVDRRATYANHAVYTFENGQIPAGLAVSNYGAGNTHSFVTSNARVRNGYLELLVNGGQTAMPYKCGEVTTQVTNIKYASVRTTAILTEPAGVCNGKSPCSQFRSIPLRPTRHVLLQI